MPSSRVIIRSIRNLPAYLSLFGVPQQSAAFEKLVTETLSHILHLPFYSSDNDDISISQRIVWLGSINPLSQAPPGLDAFAHCCDFHLAIEATRKTGANQWTQEFAQSMRHCDDFCTQNNLRIEDTYIMLVCTQLHIDAYRSIKSPPGRQYKFIPLEIVNLEKILQTSILAFTLRHLEIRRLFRSIAECVNDSTSPSEFRRLTDSAITKWQKDVLMLEKGVFVGIKSYEAMHRIGRNHIGATEILGILQKHPIVGQYFKIIGDKVSTDVISDGLIYNSFAAELEPTYDGELLFQPVTVADFKHRSKRITDSIETLK